MGVGSTRAWTNVVRRFALVLAFLVTIAAASYAEDQIGSPEDFANMSLEELMEVEIVSASRQKQRLTDVAMPVSIVTAEDIRYSGLTNLYEILQFAPSIDAVQIDRNRYALGVRRLHDTWSDRTLTLINGRVADSPIFGGSEFLRQPLLLEDIKQIEILRGPSGAAWGANAFNGAINIITKEPDECEGLLASSHVDHYGDTYHQARWAGATDRWGWRVSSSYNDVVSSSEALDRDFVTVQAPFVTYESRDSRRSVVVDTELKHRLSEQTSLSLGLGHSDMHTGGYEFLYTFPDSASSTTTTRAYTKLEKAYDDNRRLYVQWYGNFQGNRWPALADVSASENQFEGQWDFSPHEKHQSSIGASFRLTHIDQDVHSPEDIMIGDAQEERVGVFLVDRWHATDQLNIESQVYGEWYSETETDWATRLSAAYSLDERQRHTLYLAGAKSYRTPLIVLREVSTERLGGLIRILPNPDLCNEETWLLEGGYSAKLSEKATLRVDSYYQKYDEMIGFSRSAIGQFTARNQGPAEAYGCESELAFRDDWYRASLWYAYNYFVPEADPEGIDTDVDVRAFLPARHKAGATVRVFLSHDWTFNLNYKHSSFTDGSHGPWGGNIPGFDRLDLTLGKRFRIDKAEGEVLFGISDIFNETEQTVSDQGSVTYQHETPGRTFFAELILRF